MPTQPAILSNTRLIDAPDGWCRHLPRNLPVWQVILSLPSPDGTSPRHVVRCLLDFGSTHSFMVRDVATRLGATVAGSFVSFYGEGSREKRRADAWVIDLGVPFTDHGEVLMLRNFPISEGILGFGDDTPLYSVVLGCDVLTHCRFEYDGPGRRFRLERGTAPSIMTPDDAQIRTVVYGKGHGEATLSDVAAGASQIPLGDVSMYNPAGGMVISESQVLPYTGTVVGGSGALVGTTVVPTNGPTVTKRVEAGLSSGTHQWALLFGTAAGRTTLGPATSVALGDAVAAPISGPVLTKQFAVGNLSLGVYRYAVTFVTTPAGETTPGPESSTTITTADDVAAPATIGVASYNSDPAGALTANVLYSYRYTFFDAASGAETLPGPASNTFAPYDYYSTGTGSGKIARSGDQTSPSGLARRYYRTAGGGSTYKLMPGAGGGFSSNDGVYSYDIYADTALGAAAPSTSTATKRRVLLTGIPVSSDPAVTARKIYRTAVNGSDFKLLTTINDNTTTSFADNIADASLGASAPTSNTALYNAANLSGIAIGPTGTTYREVYRKPPGGADFKLLTTLSNNTATTFTDTTADGSLGAVAPTTDTSGLVSQSGEVPAGSTTMAVTSTAPFQAAGGWAFIGALPIRYTGVSGAMLTGIPGSGPGALTTSIRYGVEVIAASMLTGVSGLVRPLIKGAPINIWVRRDDLVAQAELYAREVAAGETNPSGIVEHRIVDERRGEASLIALCDADLAQFSRPIVTVTYATRDVKTKSGKPIRVNLPMFGINQTLTIQEVVIDQIDIAPGLAPRYTVTASSLRYTIEDLLRRMASTLEGQ